MSQKDGPYMKRFGTLSGVRLLH